MTKSYSCSCDTISFNEATEWADEIFFGRLIEIKEIETYQELDGKNHTRIWSALFEVEKKWKGSNSKYVEVFQPNTSCDYFFHLSNQSYIVYAKKEELIRWDSTQSFIGLGTWLCARNADASVYHMYNKNGYDDRNNLDRKFKKPIVLSSFNFNWKKIGITLLILLLGIIIGRKIEKRIANKG